VKIFAAAEVSVRKFIDKPSHRGKRTATQTCPRSEQLNSSTALCEFCEAPPHQVAAITTGDNTRKQQQQRQQVTLKLIEICNV